MPKKLHLSLYRFDPEKDERPYMADYEVEYPVTGNMMVIDAIRQSSGKRFNCYI
jgi:succinate dehydrogenase/fumarate reductase-like Fe-S protein